MRIQKKGETKSKILYPVYSYVNAAFNFATKDRLFMNLFLPPPPGRKPPRRPIELKNAILHAGKRHCYAQCVILNGGQGKAQKNGTNDCQPKLYENKLPFECGRSGYG